LMLAALFFADYLAGVVVALIRGRLIHFI
jgi:hypothetical protein